MVEPSPSICKGQSYLPSHYNQLVLSILGAIPCSFQKPYMPSLKLRESTVSYCVLFFGLTLWSAVFTISYFLSCMESSYPYNHFRFLAAFELTAMHLLHLLTLVSWADTSALVATLDAWYQFIDRYETVIKKPIPDCKNRELTLQTMILFATPVTIFIGCKVLEPEIMWDWKFLPGIFCPCTIELSFELHWLLYHWTIKKVSKELKKHLTEAASNRHLLTSQLLADYRALWILLRNVIDKISLMRVPLYVFLFQSILSTMCIFESILAYRKTGDVMVTAFNLGVSLFNVVPIALSCFAGHNTANEVQYLFEDVMNNLELSSVAKCAQKEICMIYILKRAKKPVVTLFGYSSVNLPLLLSVASSVTMYVLIFIQFEDMRQ